MRFVTSIAILVIGFGISWGLASFLGKKPVFQGPSPVNLLKQGHAADTMNQAQQLMNALSANDWSLQGVDRGLLRVADQDYAEQEFDRRPEKPTFAVHRALTNHHPYNGVIAFTSKLYVRRNYKKGVGVEGMTSKPEGFFIVGWRTGSITRVPIEQVRLSRYMMPEVVGGPGKTEVYVYVFPGMKGYKQDLLKFPGL